MNEQDYQALVLMSIGVWRFIGAIREPILVRIKIRLEDGFAIYGGQFYVAFVWMIAFIIGYGAAMAAGVDGDMLATLGWWEGHVQEFGWVFTAILIASGSAGLRWAEKSTEKKPNA